MTTRPILVGYDGSASAQAAVAWALDEGARTKTPVLLAYAFEWLTVTAPIVPGPSSWPATTARRDAEAMIKAAAAEAAESHPGVAVSGTLLDGPAALALQEKSKQARLVVLGNRGHGGFMGLLVGSTAVAVSAHAHCPVVVVRSGEAGSQAGSTHVVVGVDGSPCSLLALGFAFDQAASRGVPLHVVRAWMPPASRWRPPHFDVERIAAAERKELDDLLAGWRDKHPDVEVTSEIVADNPGRVMVDATRNASLVVVGSRGRGGFRGLLLGSISQHLLHHSGCPVAVVREVPSSSDPADPARPELVDRT